MTRKAKQPPAPKAPQNSASRRLVPPLAFLLALCLMVACFYDSGYTSLPPTAKRYDTAKAAAESLRLDGPRASQRDAWEKLAAEFRSIYEGDPGWPNRPAALFRLAESLEELARRSCAKADARKAIQTYEDVAARHADSRLADDALFQAARLRAAWLKDDKGALALLVRIKSQYPRGDMLPEAHALEKTLLASAQGRTAPEARQMISAKGKEPLEDQPPTAPAPQPEAAAQPKPAAPAPEDDLLPRYRTAKTRMEARHADKASFCSHPWAELSAEFLHIYQSRKGWAISPGALYRAAASREALGQCSLQVTDYAQARDLYLRLAQEFPKSALADDALLRAAGLDADQLDQKAEALELLDAIAALYASGDMLHGAQAMRARLLPPAPADKTAAPAREAQGRTSAQTPEKPPAQKQGQTQAEAGARNAPKVPSRPASGHVSEMARQLGLTVRTVFIDAGHGGHDPGASHNNVLERDITLDVAMTLGRLLQVNGVDVVYSRTGGEGLSLRSRTAMANVAGADLFVSIHVNAHGNSSVHGFETYYLDLARSPEAARVAALENAGSDHRLGDMQKVLADVMLTARVDESRRLARDIQTMSVSRLTRRAFSVRDNGMKSAPFHVLLGAQMPAVLVELGYCTHAGEARNLLDAKYRLTLAEGLAEGILAYKDRLLKRRTAQNSLTQESADAM